METQTETGTVAPQNDEVPLEHLEVQIAQAGASIAAATCRWLLAIAEYDRRLGWQTWECKSCAHWLNWKCGVAMRTAREHVLVGRTLQDLPKVTQAFADGALSYSKARALCRVANPNNEAELVALATSMTASQLQRTVSGLLTAKSAEAESEQANSAFANRRIKRDNNYDGSHTITLVVPADDAEYIMASINHRVDQLITDAVAAPESNIQPSITVEPGGVVETGGVVEPMSTRRKVIQHHGGLAAMRADAATELLTAPRADRAATAALSEVTVNVDADLLERPPSERRGAHCDATEPDLAPLADGETGVSKINEYRIAPSVAQRLACDSMLSTHVIGTNTTNVLDIGRRSRAVPTRLRRALEQRDNHSCQFPGCDATRRLHAHHIVWWRDGGQTKLDNLVLLCNFHHHAVHEGGWTISSPQVGVPLRFFRPGGAAAPPSQLPAKPFPLNTPPGDLMVDWHGERPDYSYITANLIHNEGLGALAA